MSPYCKLAFLSTTTIFVFRNHLADPKICISPVPTPERQGLEYQIASEVLNYLMKGFGLLYIPHKMSKQQTLPVTARQAGYCRARSSYHSSTWNTNHNLRTVNFGTQSRLIGTFLPFDSPKINITGKKLASALQSRFFIYLFTPFLPAFKTSNYFLFFLKNFLCKAHRRTEKY